DPLCTAYIQPPIGTHKSDGEERIARVHVGSIIAGELKCPCSLPLRSVAASLSVDSLRRPLPWCSPDHTRWRPKELSYPLRPRRPAHSIRSIGLATRTTISSGSRGRLHRPWGRSRTWSAVFSIRAVHPYPAPASKSGSATITGTI